MPPVDFEHRRHHIRLQQATPYPVVPGHLSRHPGQEGHLQYEAGPPPGISYNAAWRMKRKLMQVMLERGHHYKLSGFIEPDDAYLGGERTGCKPGRGAEGRR